MLALLSNIKWDVIKGFHFIVLLIPLPVSYTITVIITQIHVEIHFGIIQKLPLGIRFSDVVDWLFGSRSGRALARSPSAGSRIMQRIMGLLLLCIMQQKAVSRTGA